MRVLWIVERFPPQKGGVAAAAGRQVAGLGPRLEGIDVLQLTRDLAPGEVVAGSEGSVRVHRIGQSRRDDESLRLLFQVGATIAARNDPDLVHGFYAGRAGYAAVTLARRLGRPSLVSLRGNDVELGMFHGSRLSLLQATLSGADALLGVSREILDAARLIVGDRPGMRFVPNGVDGDLFVPAATPMVTDPPVRLVYQGTLAPWQGLDTLIEALTRFRSAPVELHVIGPAKSHWRRRLRLFARRCRVHHQVQLLPATGQADLAPILHTAHVCVAPLAADARNAVQGCCPIKLLEYMAAARPILATAISPVEEILEHELTAWLARPGSPLALADGITWMLDHPAEREELGRRAREAALASWGPDAFRAKLAAAVAGLEE